MSSNPFTLGEIEIPGPVVFHILMAWRGGADGKIARLKIPKAPKNLRAAIACEPNYAVCLNCFRIAGHLDGGQLLDKCSKCQHEPRNESFWAKLGAYSNILDDWATDRVVCKVIGTVIDFNRGKLRLPEGALK